MIEKEDKKGPAISSEDGQHVIGPHSLDIFFRDAQLLDELRIFFCIFLETKTLVDTGMMGREEIPKNSPHFSGAFR